ncbi:MAG: hypothetical protein AAGJ81_02465 [Verrucomicrobiota bacterium]
MYNLSSKRDGSFLTAKDDSRIPPGIRVRKLRKGGISYKRWLLPLSWGHLTLREAYEYLTIVGAPQGEIPEVIRWTEGKDSHLVKQFFYGGVDLRAHDYIHILLGRGLLPKDEAFVIGFTMGSTNRLHSMNEDAFAYIAKHHYPNAYRMDDESREVFLDATKLGFVSDCTPLDQIDFKPFLDTTIDEVRKRINLRPDLLEAYFRDVEQLRFPEDPASKRLLPPTPPRDDRWILYSEDDQRKMSDVVAELNHLLDESDVGATLEEAEFQSNLSAARTSVLEHLEGQRDLAKHCFEEIDRVLEGENPQARRDVEEARWNDFYEQAKGNVELASAMVDREVHHLTWEGHESEQRELRTWVHAILGRGASPRDRAFCRGFYHGSSNNRTSYASLLKLGLMQNLPICRDGLFSEDMSEVYNDGVRLGHISPCKPLAEVDFESLSSFTVREARQHIDLKTGLLSAYQRGIEDQRLLL